MSQLGGNIQYREESHSPGNAQTQETAILVKDMNHGSSGSFVSNFQLLNGIPYFSASGGANGSRFWKSDGTTTGSMLVSTHDMKLVQELFPCTIVMDEGRIVADGRTQEILEDEKLLNEQGLEKP